MEYMGNKEYWDKKFAARGNQLMNPESVLVENIQYLKRGTLLDIACGDGRNTMYLLEQGFQVTGVDFSREALDRLSYFARMKNYKVDTMQIDLSKEDAFSTLGTYDSIIINHYRLGAEKLMQLEHHLTEGGVLFISGFGHKHHVDSKIRSEDLIMPDDFAVIEESFELLKYSEIDNEIGFLVTYLYKKNRN
ncbi:MAG TPA: methyltransferase [Lachnospiraceae bacterium]|nr:methyltransferase [Lachnospiraceae bacterium]